LFLKQITQQQIMKTPMNKLFKTILIFSITLLSAALPIGGQGFLFVPSALANGNLVVVFQPNPLFSEANFLPGDTVGGSAQVTNNTAETQKIGTQAVSVSDPDDLGGVLYLEIKENATSLYTGTLSDFFTAGEIYLSDLAGNGANTTYEYSITFDSNAGDEYQGLGLGFDINIGFFGEESVSTEVPAGSSSGGGYSAQGLNIFNEAIGGVGSDTVTITWDTNLIATSRVIYSPSTSNPIFDINTPPNYGYDYSTTEDSDKVLDHTVVITGLNPATVYFFRCVSHASPDTISPEYSFTTLGPGESAITEETPLYPEEGEVLGASIIRAGLPETGGIIDRIVKRAGFSSSKSDEFKINLIIAAGLVFIWITLILLRKVIGYKNNDRI